VSRSSCRTAGAWASGNPSPPTRGGSNCRAGSFDEMVEDLRVLAEDIFPIADKEN